MTLTIPSDDTFATIRQLHPLLLDLVLLPNFDYQFEHTFVLDRTLFAQALAIAPYLFSGGLSRMVYEHISRCFILEDPSLRFSKLFQATAIIVRGDIPRSMALVLWANKLLAMAKDIGGFCPITTCEVFFQLINCSIVLQL